MPKILTICPTYNRPDLCNQMITSWRKTITDDNTLVLGLDIGDPSISDYSNKVNKIVCKHGSTVTEVINDIWKQHPNYKYYHITNDDVLYHTPGWDSKMSYILEEYGDGVAYGNDLFMRENLPTFPFISANLAKAVGWLQHPSLNRYCGDTVWAMIGKNCNCLYYLGEVIIEHLHKLAGKGDTDVDMPVFEKDWHSYVQWYTTRMQDDVGRVREVLNGTN